MFSPQEALSAGFLDRVVPAEELHDASLQKAVELSELNAAAHAPARAAARRVLLGRVPPCRQLRRSIGPG